MCSFDSMVMVTDQVWFWIRMKLQQMSCHLLLKKSLHLIFLLHSKNITYPKSMLPKMPSVCMFYLFAQFYIDFYLFRLFFVSFSVGVGYARACVFDEGKEGVSRIQFDWTINMNRMLQPMFRSDLKRISFLNLKTGKWRMWNENENENDTKWC